VGLGVGNGIRRDDPVFEHRIAPDHNRPMETIMAENTVEALRGRANDFDTVQHLGNHVQRLGALLRAAINTSDREDEAWLVSIAHDEAETAEAAYERWANRGEAK
jgi:hypothetical protein